MIRLALQSLRFRPTSAIGTFVAIFVGATIVFAFGALMETGLRGDVAPQRLAAAGVVVIGQQQFEILDGAPGTDEDKDSETATLPEEVSIDDALLAPIAGVRGVRAAIGDVSFAATVIRDGEPVAAGNTFGHTFSSTVLAPYTLIAGAAPVGAGQVAVDGQLPGATVGGQVDLMVGGVQHSYRISGVLAAPATTRDTAVFFDDATARQLSGHLGSWASIGVLLDPGLVGPTVDRIAGDIRTITKGNATVLTGPPRGR